MRGVHAPRSWPQCRPDPALTEVEFDGSLLGVIFMLRRNDVSFLAENDCF